MSIALRMKPLSLMLNIVLGSSLLIGGVGYSADVPDGVELAEKQTFVRNNGTEPQSLDPHKIEGVPESNLSRDLFEGLAIVNPQGELVPGAATAWENDDFRVWRFTIRPEAKWSNGEPVTAHDFVYSWKRLADPNTASPYASFLQYGHIKNVDEVIVGKMDPDQLGVAALDDATFEVTLSEAVPYFPQLTAHEVLSPVHKSTVETFGDRWTRPDNIVGNGAYKLKHWVVNERIELERNPKYWDNDKTVINDVTFLAIESDTSELNRYRSGALDMTATLSIDHYPRLKKEIPNEIMISPLLCTYYYEINHEQEKFKDPKVREAVKLSLDRDIIVDKIMQTGQKAAFGFTPPFISGFTAIEPEWFSWTQAERNDRAKKLLAEAGYTKSKPLEFTILYNTSEAHRKLAIAASSIWKQNAGINVKMENQEWKTFLDTRQQGNFDVARAGWCADYNEPTSFLNILLSDSSNNTTNYKSAAYDALMKKSVQVKSDEERNAIYQQAEKMLDDESVIVPVYYYVNGRLVKPYVGGYFGKDPLGKIYTKDLYIEKH